MAVQLRLGLAVDGVYGPITQTAVTAFQRTHDLPPTGTVDADTWATLQPLPTACPQPAAEPITAAPGAGKTVALTFDDGPGPFTPQVLAVLGRFGVPATFFDTGLHDVSYPQYARSIVAAGDVLGNYTRPPGGAFDAISLALVRSLGMSMVMWTTGTNDWQQPPYLSAAFQRLIIANAEAGAALQHPVILMHAGKASHEPECDPGGCAPGQVSSFRGNTVAALPTVIEFYLSRGYRFVTM